jgi:primosomal protein N' (replication factor Y)
MCADRRANEWAVSPPLQDVGVDRDLLPDLAGATPVAGIAAGAAAARPVAGTPGCATGMASLGEATAPGAAPAGAMRNARHADPGALRAATPPPRVAEVAVTLPVAGRFHYSVPEPLAARAVVGARVLVRFGNRKVTGVVVRTDTAPPVGVAPIAISEVLDDVPALSVELVELCTWIAEYYEAPPGEVIRAALPAGSGVAARRVYALTTAGRAVLDGGGGAMLPRRRALLARIGGRELAAAGLAAGVKHQLEELAAQGLVEHREQREAGRVRLKRERVVQLVGSVDAARAAASRAPRRLAVVEALADGEAVAVSLLEQRLPGAKVAVRELVRLGLAAVAQRESPIAVAAAGVGEAMAGSAPPVLTDEQRVAVDQITAALRRTQGACIEHRRSSSAGSTGSGPDREAAAASGDREAAAASGDREAAAASDGAADAAPFAPFLLHGVTGSGKTEVYLRVIAEALAAGRTALVLVPEISLTPQLAARFRARFGDLVAILHSGLSETARLGEWSRLRRGDARIAVGARSAVFAPLAELGAIVVDEEHDGSFKQDEGVRYHARDVALVRAQRAGAVCVLGSATPSLETAAHAERAAYRKLTLTQRPTARPMPSVEIIDLRTYVPDGDAMLSAPLRAAIGEALAAGDQTILFLNRRGFATFVLCRGCGHAFRCPHCSVSLTYHRHSDRLACHYCGFAQRVPEACPACGATGTIERKGLGTEKVADAIAAAFPSARVARLDRDVASGAKIEAVLSRVARREVDVLVGTQMVTKGHDFPGVTLVGVLCADTGLNLPDFRAAERTFQLLAQVAGRAGRGDRPGRVMIQTYRPRAPAVLAAAAHDYASFFAAESAARAELGFPPHGRLIAVRVDGADAHEVAGAAQQLAQLATAAARRLDVAGLVEIRGPVPAPLERLRNRTRWQVWLRSADRHALRRVARSLLAADLLGSVRMGLDVDPMSAM